MHYEVTYDGVLVAEKPTYKEAEKIYNRIAKKPGWSRLYCVGFYGDNRRDLMMGTSAQWRAALK